jgi:transposase InsO family protein
MRQALRREIQQGRAVSVRWACRVLGLTRSGYYRWRSRPVGTASSDAPVRKALLRVARQWTRYGARRITQQLRREGMDVGMKRVRRLMREEKLIVRPKKRYVRTTNSDHGWPIHSNRATGLILTGLNQLWVADLTYVRLRETFLYVAVILDAFSRKVIGWAISRSLEADFAIEALRMALRRRGAPKGLVHHSDRGVQYASKGYVNLLQHHGITISMSAKGNPYDNAKAESFMKTFKYDEVELFEYKDEADARKRIGRFLNHLYNNQRLHSALGYLPPAEFEQKLRPKPINDPSPALDSTAAPRKNPPQPAKRRTGSAGEQPAQGITGRDRVERCQEPPQKAAPPKSIIRTAPPCLKKTQPHKRRMTATGTL